MRARHGFGGITEWVGPIGTLYLVKVQRQLPDPQSAFIPARDAPQHWITGRETRWPIAAAAASLVGASSLDDASGAIRLDSAARKGGGGRQLNTEEAVRRVKLIVDLLLKDVRAAVTVHVTMETFNETIPAALRNKSADPAYTFNAVQEAMALKLALDVARIFDVTEGGQHPVEEQDKASVPVLAALLAREDVKGVLVEEARHWTPIIAEEQMAACRHAVAEFIRAAQSIRAEGTEEREAFVRIRQFRTRRLAHNLIDKPPDALPLYSDLTLLTGLAMKAVKLGALAINGNNIDPQMWIDRDHDGAEKFCRCLVAGAAEARTG